MCIYSSLQIVQAESDDDLKMCLNMDEVQCSLYETGCRKAVSSLKLSDRPAVDALLDYHLMVKVKAEMDQF